MKKKLCFSFSAGSAVWICSISAHIGNYTLGPDIPYYSTYPVYSNHSEVVDGGGLVVQVTLQADLTALPVNLYTNKLGHIGL